MLLAEDNTNRAINNLLVLSKQPLTQFIEQEREEEARLLAAANKYNEQLRKDDVLAAMQELLEQEAKRFIQLDEIRYETARNILEE